MPRIDVKIIRAFVDGSAGGNPAGVVLQAEHLDTATKQLIAARVGLSETAFISRSEIADFKLEFFTPNKQIAHCGHATIAAFSYLVQNGLLKGVRSSKETIDGCRDIFLRDGLVFMEQRAPRFMNSVADAPLQDILDALNLQKKHLMSGQVPEVVNTGVNFLVVPLRDEATVLSAEPDFPAILAISEALDLVGFHIFSSDVRVPGRHAGARMFAPRYAIEEEAATGMASGPLACFLWSRLGVKQKTILLEQGHLMKPPSPSLIQIDLETAHESIERLLVGGRGLAAQGISIEI